jgi:hypothetical protein
MDIEPAAWTPAYVARRRAKWPLRRDFLAVAVLCVIFGLQILAVMLCAGGPEIYSTVVNEGMQLP